MCESLCVRACIGEERLWGPAARRRNDKHRDACARATTSTEMHARRPSVCARETVAAWVRTRADGRGIAHRPVTSASSTLPSRTSSEHCLHLSAARLHWDRQSIHRSTDRRAASYRRGSDRNECAQCAHRVAGEEVEEACTSGKAKMQRRTSATRLAVLLPIRATVTRCSVSFANRRACSASVAPAANDYRAPRTVVAFADRAAQFRDAVACGRIPRPNPPLIAPSHTVQRLSVRKRAATPLSAHARLAASRQPGLIAAARTRPGPASRADQARSAPASRRACHERARRR